MNSAALYNTSPVLPNGKDKAHNEVINKAHRKPVQYSRIGYLGSVIFENARKIADAAHQKIFSNYVWVQSGLFQIRRVIKFSSLFDAMIVPFIIANIATQGRCFIKGQSSARIDSAIQLINDMGLLGRSVTIIGMGLASIGGISVKILDWTPSLFVATAVLSFASMAATYMTHLKMKNFEQRFAKIAQLNDSANETSLETFQTSIEFIKAANLTISKGVKDQDFVAHALGCTTEKLEIRLLEIKKEAADKLASTKVEEQQAGKRLLNNTLRTLKGHIHHVSSNAKISAIVSAVGLVASIVLFATPIAPLSCVIASAGLAANLGILIHHKVVEYRYAQSLGLQRKWYEWITC